MKLLSGLEKEREDKHACLVFCPFTSCLQCFWALLESILSLPVLPIFGNGKGYEYVKTGRERENVIVGLKGQTKYYM